MLQKHSLRHCFHKSSFSWCFCRANRSHLFPDDPKTERNWNVSTDFFFLFSSLSEQRNLNQEFYGLLPDTDPIIAGGTKTRPLIVQLMFKFSCFLHWASWGYWFFLDVFSLMARSLFFLFFFSQIKIISLLEPLTLEKHPKRCVCAVEWRALDRMWAAEGGQ